jgi:hypothetical protein
VDDILAGGSISEHITMLGIHRQLVHPARPLQPSAAISVEEAYEYVKKENRRTMAKDTMCQQELLVGVKIKPPSAPRIRMIEVPYFVSSELLGTRWTEYRMRLEELQEKQALTDMETVNLLTEACSMHPKIHKYLSDIICPGTRVSK